MASRELNCRRKSTAVLRTQTEMDAVALPSVIVVCLATSSDSSAIVKPAEVEAMKMVTWKRSYSHPVFQSEHGIKVMEVIELE